MDSHANFLVQSADDSVRGKLVSSDESVSDDRPSILLGMSELEFDSRERRKHPVEQDELYTF